LSWLAPAAGFNPVELTVKGTLFGSIPKPVSSVACSSPPAPPLVFFFGFSQHNNGHAERTGIAIATYKELL